MHSTAMVGQESHDSVSKCMQCLERDMHGASSDRTHSFVTHSRKLRSSACGTSMRLAQFFTSSEEGCSEEHRPCQQDQAPTQNNGCMKHPPNDVQKMFCSGWCNTICRCNTVSHKLCNWHADPSRRSIVYLSRERTARRISS